MSVEGSSSFEQCEGFVDCTKALMGLKEDVEGASQLDRAEQVMDRLNIAGIDMRDGSRKLSIPRLDRGNLDVYSAEGICQRALGAKVPYTFKEETRESTSDRMTTVKIMLVTVNGESKKIAEVRTISYLKEGTTSVNIVVTPPQGISHPVEPRNAWSLPAGASERWNYAIRKDGSVFLNAAAVTDGSLTFFRKHDHGYENQIPYSRYGDNVFTGSKSVGLIVRTDEEKYIGEARPE